MSETVVENKWNYLECWQFLCSVSVLYFLYGVRIHRMIR
uniref:Uncharacterized protein n=1 Tax=Anguilla anguilla TaxID=7936 RepID=A0A0E9SSM9_ANGAN